MVSAGFMIGFAGQMNKLYDEKRAQEQKDKDFLRESAVYMNQQLVPQAVKRRAEEEATYKADKAVGMELATRGLTDEQISTIYDAHGSAGLVRARDVIVDKDSKSKTPLTPAEVQKLVVVAKGSGTDGSWLDTLEKHKPTEFEFGGDFRLDVEDEGLQDYVYAPSYGTGGGTGVYSIVSPEADSSMSMTEQGQYLDVMINPALINVVDTAIQNDITATQEGQAHTLAPEQLTVLQNVQTNLGSKYPDYNSAINALSSIQMLPETFLSDLAIQDPSILNITAISPVMRTQAADIISAQQSLMSDLEGASPEEQQMLIGAFVKARTHTVTNPDGQTTRTIDGSLYLPQALRGQAWQ